MGRVDLLSGWPCFYYVPDSRASTFFKRFFKKKSLPRTLDSYLNMIVVDLHADEPSCDLHSSLPHQAMETYMCGNDHKCYAIRTATHELFLLFSNDVPNYALG